VNLKRLLFRLIGKEPEAVVVSFCSGPRDLALRMVDEVRRLVPDREHYAVADYDVPGVVCVRPENLPGPLRRKRIGLAPTLFTGEKHRLRLLAFRMAPLKVLAYNRNLERHHLQLRSLMASVLFLRGVPLDRIWLRPRWLAPWKRDRSWWPSTHSVHEGRPTSSSRRRVAVLSPYFPYPLSHGGAVRIFNLLREASRDFDIFLFSFAESPDAAVNTPVLNYCAAAITFQNPRYREPRWASIRPPEVNEYYTPYVAKVLNEFRRRYEIRILQVEYTQMAAYGGDALVEHDVTWDLYTQIANSTATASERLATSWNLWRWKRFEKAAVKRFPAVVAMSAKDAAMLSGHHVHVIPNGVDLHRFRPEPETLGHNVLFVGSFAHFPNVVAYRWFLDAIWPTLSAQVPDVRFTVIAGRNPELYCPEPPSDSRINFHGFISDVRPYYAAANVVVVPTRVSAGTNLKVLEAMALERAVVSTPSGCAGLGLQHGKSVWIADQARAFADAVKQLLLDPAQRIAIAREGRAHVEQHYGWDRIGVLQRRLWTLLLTAPGVRVRKGHREDLPSITRIQQASHGSSTWQPDTYFAFDVHVAEKSDGIAGFMVSRSMGPDEAEILNLAVAPEARRSGVGTALIETLEAMEVFLEVRESNTAAQGLYSKLGFRVVGRRDGYYDDPAEAALVMRRSRATDR
jgi:polysaccharide biosynthesis protein PslH